jgi:UDP-glucuronate decarboxylase
MKMERMKSILVTGGAGFIGSHLCDRLIGRGQKVICVDNLFTGQRSNIKHLLDNDRFEFMRHDIVQPLLVDVDQIYNLACPAAPVHYQRNPVKTIETNVIGVYNMAELARKVGARILQASTSEVYGDPDVHPQVEEYWGNVNPIGPRSCYDEGKRCAETLLTDYHKQNGIDIRIARIFNTYGPNMRPDDGRVVSNFIVQALKGLPLTIFGDGCQTRSFCYVDDTVSALIGLMGWTGAGAELPANIGNPEEITIHDLACLIWDLTSSKGKTDGYPAIDENLPIDDPRRRRPDIDRISAMIDWKPTTDLNRGLELTIAYFRSYFKKNM